jgi:hypothetical protein
MLKWFKKGNSNFKYETQSAYSFKTRKQYFRLETLILELRVEKWEVQNWKTMDQIF